MYKFTKSIFINRSQQDVFDFLSNPTNMPKWQPAIVSAEWTSADKAGVGSTYRVLVKMFGSKTESLFEITHWDPPNRYSYRSTKISAPAESIETVITLAPKEKGTQLTFEAQIGAVSKLKFLEGVLGKVAEKGDGNNIDTLKQLLEAG